MIKRAVSVFAVGALALVVLTGCQTTPGAFVRSAAQADVAGWTRQAAVAAGSPAASTRSDGYENCRTDTGLFIMRFQWRAITDLAVAQSNQSAVTSDIAAAFDSKGWAEKDAPGLVTLTGPKSAKRRGVVAIQSGGDSQLSISVISPCYS